MSESANNQLATITTQHSLSNEKAVALKNAFIPFAQQAADLIEQSRGIEVTDVSQVGAMEAARQARLALAKVRNAAEKARKALKDESLREGKAIDAVNKWFLSMVEPEEARLQEAEDFAVNAERERVAQLVAERTRKIQALGGNPAIFVLSQMDDAAFEDVLTNLKQTRERELEEQKKREAFRQAEERDREAYLERVEAENERLRMEAAERERLAKIERDRVEADRKKAEAAKRKQLEEAETKAREEREKLEAEAKAKQAEAAKKLAAANERRKAIEQNCEALLAAAKAVCETWEKDWTNKNGMAKTVGSLRKVIEKVDQP